MRWLLWGQTGALAVFLLACGGAPSTLTQGEEAVEAGKYDEAERLLLATQGGYLTESEKARVKVALGIVAHKQVSGRTRAAGLEGLRGAGGDPPLVSQGRRTARRSGRQRDRGVDGPAR